MGGHGAVRARAPFRTIHPASVSLKLATISLRMCVCILSAIGANVKRDTK